jgi:integrase
MDSPVRKVKILKAPNGKSPYWYLRWWEPTVDGSKWKERWKSTKTTVKKDADRQRRELERELDDGRRADAKMTWEDFVKEFETKHAARKPTTTLSMYKQCLKAFTETAKPKQLAKVTHGLLEDFANQRLGEGFASATVNKDLRHIRAALRWAKRRGYISEAPDFKDVFIREDRKKPIVIPEKDFLALVKALRKQDLSLKHRPPDWWRVFLYVAYYLGLRRGEILGMTWGQVALDTLEVHVLAPTSKARKERVVPLSEELGAILGEWKAQSPNAGNNDEVLPWPHDTYRQLYEDWHAIQTAAGIPENKHYVPKNCRSSCASELIAANVPTVVVKDFLGHATVATTENYYINTKPAMRAAANARKVRLEESDRKAEGGVPPQSG